MKAMVIVGADEIFPDLEVPQPIEEIVQNISKETLIFYLAKINYNLKPKTSLFTDYSIDTQRNLFEEYCPITNLRIHYLRKIDEYQKKHYESPVFEKALFFNRQACIYGIELLLNSELEFDNENSNLEDPYNLERLMLFLCCLNSRVSAMKSKSNSPEFEELNAVMLPLNDISIDADIFYEPIRGYELIDFLTKNQKIGPFLSNFFLDKYGVSYKDFFKTIIGLYLSKKNERSDMECIVKAKQNTKLLDELSKRIPNENLFDLLSIKVGPLLKLSSKKDYYIILDYNLLLERAFTNLINDLWFNGVKAPTADSTNAIPIKEFKGYVGKFTEKYVQDTLEFSFERNKYMKLYTFEDLEILGENKNEELADFYLRRDNKVCIGQVKCSALNTLQRTSADLKEMYKKEPRKFYDTHGMDQIVRSVLKLNSIHDLDKGYSINSRKDIYPVLIVVDKVFQTPFFSDQFNREFRKRLYAEKENIPKKHTIHLLALIHITDLEHLSNNLNKKPKLIWKILKDYSSNNRLIPPFYSITRKFIKKPSQERLLSFYSKFLD